MLWPRGAKLQHERAQCDCGRVVRLFYRYQNRVACVACHDLKHASKNASKLQQRARKPTALKAALKDADKWLTSMTQGKKDNRRYSDFIGIIMATNEHEQITRDDAQDFEKLQARVIVADVVKSSELMARIEATIEGGTEHKVTRSGDSIEVPMSVDSLSKLAHAWAVLANLRANRSGISSQIVETRSSEKGDTMREKLKAAMRENNYRFANGQTYTEFEAQNAARRDAERTPLALPQPKVE